MCIKIFCKECGNPIPGNDIRKRFCSPECLRERKNRYKRKYAKEHPELRSPYNPIKKYCIICGKEVPRGYRKLCGDPDCTYQNERNVINAWRARQVKPQCQSGTSMSTG